MLPNLWPNGYLGAIPYELIHNPMRQFHSLIAILIGLVLLASCSTSTSSVEGLEDQKKPPNKNSESIETAEAEETSQNKEKVEVAKVIRKSGTVSKKGTHIKVLVNNVPVTNYDISRRAAFLRLRRIKGNRTKIAEDEMIEQAIKMSEARAQRTVADKAQVDTAFANFAKSNRVPPNRLATELGRMGIGADHFKGFIRTQISWQRTVGKKFSSATRQKTQQEAIFELKQSGSEKPETTEYVIKQIVFVVPKDKRKAIMGARRKEANGFKQRFSSCSQAIDMAKELRDVSVVDRGRVLEPELPPNWRDEILKTETGKTTKPIVTEKGVELIAVCDKRNVSDDRAAQILSQSKDFESFNQKGAEAGKQYLDELRKKAVIIYR